MASFVKRPLRLGIVAGEISGDLLAADLLKQLKCRGIPFVVEGIAGPAMQQQGCRSLFPMETLSVMGLGEIVKQLFAILRLRKQLVHHFMRNPPDIFIGVDAPEFNLSLEKQLKRHNIRTVHYVSPSVWAWRPWRIKKIARAVDLMLTLFPFETDLYQKYSVPVKYVGHPFADSIALQTSFLQARRALDLPENKIIIAVLPGSRRNEIDYLGRLFLETVQRCYKLNPSLLFIAAMVNEEREAQFTALKLAVAPQLPIKLIRNASRQVIAAANVVLLASGTATLEAMLFKKPMVVAYGMSTVSYLMAKCLVRVNHIALPNLLAQKTLVPEFIQKQATPEKLTNALCCYLNNPTAVSKLQKEFLSLHQQLRCDASRKAVDALLELIFRTWSV